MDTPDELLLTSEGDELIKKTYPLFTLHEKTKKKYKVIPEGSNFSWNGGKIPLSLWRQVISFFRWSFTKYKSEALVQLFYNPDTMQWAVWAFPQRGIGMTVNHILTDPRYDLDRARFPEPWFIFGSVHHHCDCSAFSSGTDHEDEKYKDGLHITVGKLKDATLDIHSRVAFKAQFYTTKIESWFSCGKSEFLGDLDELDPQFTGWLIRHPCEDLHPKEWEDRFSNVYFGGGNTALGAQNPTMTPRIIKNGSEGCASKSDRRGKTRHVNRAAALLLYTRVCNNEHLFKVASERQRAVHIISLLAQTGYARITHIIARAFDCESHTKYDDILLINVIDDLRALDETVVLGDLALLYEKGILAE